MKWAKNNGDDDGKQKVNFEIQERSYTTDFDLREDTYLIGGVVTDVFNTDKTKICEKGYVQLEERKSRIRSRPTWYKNTKVGGVSEYLMGAGNF